MEHMKRMLVIAAAAVLAGAGLMFVHRHMYKNCADNVQVQNMKSAAKNKASSSFRTANNPGEIS